MDVKNKNGILRPPASEVIQRYVMPSGMVSVAEVELGENALHVRIAAGIAEHLHFVIQRLPVARENMSARDDEIRRVVAELEVHVAEVEANLAALKALMVGDEVPDAEDDSG